MMRPAVANKKGNVFLSHSTSGLQCTYVNRSIFPSFFWKGLCIVKGKAAIIYHFLSVISKMGISVASKSAHYEEWPVFIRPYGFVIISVFNY